MDYFQAQRLASKQAVSAEIIENDFLNVIKELKNLIVKKLIKI